MKKIAFIGIAIATAMGFTACQKENLSNGQAEGQLISETFTATLGQEATKTTISDDAATVTWAAGDNVYYYSKDGGTVRSFTISAAGASASLTLERETSDTYYNLVYAGGSAPTFTTKTSTSMVFDGVKSAQDGTFQNANVSVASTTPGGAGITFKPVVSIVKFTTARTDIKTIVLTGGNGEKVAGNISVDPTAAPPVAALDGEGSASITVTIVSPAAGTYYIGVIPGTYSNGLKLTLKNSSDAVIGYVIASNSTDLSAGDAMINYGNVDSHIVPTLLTGKFSVGASKQVQFTRGNLYWDGAAWQLEASQTDYPASWSSTHVGHLYWTKDAANSYAETYSDGTCTTSDVPFFAESKGGLTVEGTDGLFALSSAEWTYLISTRTNASSLYKYGVTVSNGGTNYTNCLIIAPDDFTGTLASSYTLDQVNASGLVCLPAAGYRDGSDLSSVGSYGDYWSATPYGDGKNSAYYLNFVGSGVFPSGYDYRRNGYSVRLVYFEGVTLSETAAAVTGGSTKTLTYTVAPAGTTVESAVWSSSAEAVASVDQNGVVTGVNVGTATITITINGTYTATCEVTVSAPIYTEGGYSGEGIKIGNTWWAPVNCGYHATNYPYGKLYQWGRAVGGGYNDTYSYAETAQTVTSATYTDGYNKNPDDSKFYTQTGSPFDWYANATAKQLSAWPMKSTDAGYVEGKIANPCPTGWRVPTNDELNALLGGNSSPSLTTVGGQKGCYFNGTSSASSGVFLPVAGYISSGNAYLRGTRGYYWSSSVYSYNGLFLDFCDSYAQMNVNRRADGHSVRCVKE